MERKVLSALLTSREAYDRLAPVISEEDFSEQGEILFRQIHEYYQHDPRAQNVDKDILNARLQREFPKHYERLSNAVNSLEQTSENNVVKEYIDLRAGKAANDAAQALLSKDSNKIQAAIEEYQRWSTASDIEEEQDENLQGIRLSDLASHESDDSKIKVFPAALNNIFDGGFPPETHILIYAPPEVGKSQLSINMACGFLTQGKRVLYIGNEDPSKNMLFRFYSCLTGMEKGDMLRDLEGAQEKADALGFNNLIFVSQEGGTITKLRDQVEKYKPDVVFVDQIGNFTAGEKEGTQALEHISRGVRGVAKKYKIVAVSVHQGDAKAQGKLYLDLGDVYYSNVGVQGAMDVMIGVGCTADMLEGPRRMLNITKNKLTGIHDPVEVSFLKNISRVQ